MIFPKTSGLSAGDDARLSRIEAALPRTAAGRVVYSASSLSVPASSAVLPSGLISPSSGIAATGNTFSFVVQGSFAFTYSAGTLRVYWDGSNGSAPFVIRRADNSNLSVPKGSMAISGLATGIKYGLAPYIVVERPSAISFVAGDTGAPRFVFSPAAPVDSVAEANRTQRLAANEALTVGLIYFSTANGSGPGTDINGNNPYTGQP